MKDSKKVNDQSLENVLSNSRSQLEIYFINSLKEMYTAETEIGSGFDRIKRHLQSPKLIEILDMHYALHLKHKERLAKLFKLRDEKIEIKNCEVLEALLKEGRSHLAIFYDDIINWEIALIIISQKFAHYKIASYGGLAHLAINLNFYPAAALLAVSVQEEEEFTMNHLNGILDSFLSSNVKGYKTQIS